MQNYLNDDNNDGNSNTACIGYLCFPRHSRSKYRLRKEKMQSGRALLARGRDYEKNKNELLYYNVSERGRHAESD